VGGFGVEERGGGIEFWCLSSASGVLLLFCVSFGVRNDPLFFSR